MGDVLFRWVHLSDIHIGHGDASNEYNQKFVLDCLRRDIALMVHDGHAPVDAMFVTGDIAFSGAGRRASEYADAKDWLLRLGKAAGVDASRIFVVPGNHDVNRKADADRSVGRLVKALRNGEEPFDSALASAADCAMLRTRMEAYLTFAADFAPHASAQVVPGSWVVPPFETRGLRVRVVGLNTALLAADENDHGRLRLGNTQVVDAFIEPPIDEGEVVMVLSHHPLRAGWLADEKDADVCVRRHAHVHLSGHVHEADSEDARAGAGGSLVRIVAGAAHADAQPGGSPRHGYSFGAFAPEGDAVAVRIWPRVWSHKNGDFRVDVDNVPPRADFATHTLRVHAPKTAAPVAIFASYCGADRELWSRLQSHLALVRRENIASLAGGDVQADAGALAAHDRALASARIVLLLLSPDYVGSDHVKNVVLDAAQRRKLAGDAVVVPICLRALPMPAWLDAAPRLPANGLPVTAGHDGPRYDAAFTAIAVELKELATRLGA